MAEIKVRYSELTSDEVEDKIVVSAFQSERFLKIVNKQLKEGAGRRARGIAKSHVNQAVRNLQQVLQSGITGASGGKRKVTAHDVDGSSMPVTVSFPPLTASTLKTKNSRIGKGKFWLDRGNYHKGRQSLRDIAASVNPPRVTYTTNIAPLTLRKSGKGSRVDFTVTLKFDEMNFPFDDLVRRPLVRGEADDFLSEYPDSDEKSSVFVYLEYGTLNPSRGSIQPRGFIRGMSAKLGERMFDRINSN